MPTAAWEFARTARIIELSQGEAHFLSEELNLAAGLAWSVYQTPAFFFVPAAPDGEIGYDRDGFARLPASDGYWKLVARNSKGIASPAYYLNVREDSRQIVGIVKKRYRVLQNDDAPRFLDQLVDGGDAAWSLAGELHGGAQIFWLMDLTSPVSIGGDRKETLHLHLLLTNSHDGSTSLTVAVVASRPQSRATLAYSVPTARRLMKVKHTDSARRRTIEARRALDLSCSYQHQLVALALRMIEAPLSDSEFRAFVDTVLPTPVPRRDGKRVVNQRGITMAENTKGLITSVYYNNDTQANIRGTVWGAVQACQFVADHLGYSRNTDDANADENRFKRLTSESNLGNKAFSSALRRLSR